MSLRKRGPNWFYTNSDENGKRVERRGCSDKRKTLQMREEMKAQVARIRDGLDDPKAERMARDQRRPIGDHLDDYIVTLTAKGNDPKHVAQTRTYARRVIDLAGIGRIPDLKSSAVTQALATLREQGRATRTINAHATAVKAFSRWLWKDGRCVDHPLACLGKANEETDRRLVRRPLTDDELRRLIDATRSAPEWRGMSGEDRAWFYTIGAMTCLRRSELASLTPDGFRLGGDSSTIVVGAAYTKNGKLAEQPITPALASALGPWLASKTPGQPVFPELPEKTGLMLKWDLQRVGIRAKDEAGRVVDMHSLRHGYITTLARSGVPVKTLQALARHSDPKLTLNIYAHLSASDKAAAIGALPDLTGPRPEPLPTGEATPGATPIDDGLAASLPCASLDAHGGETG